MPQKMLRYQMRQEANGFAWSYESPSACTVESIMNLLESQHSDVCAGRRLLVLPRRAGNDRLLSSYVDADNDKLNDWSYVHDPSPKEPHNKVKFYLALAPACKV